MAGVASRFAFKMVAVAVAVPVGKAVSAASSKAWTAARPGRAPVNPRDADTNWKDALIWASLSGVGTAVAQLATTKGADTIWRAMTGHPSPRPKQVKDDKGPKAPSAITAINA
jgi:NADPH:quinone reductase-like Zn-dependent oxidoreductase